MAVDYENLIMTLILLPNLYNSKYDLIIIQMIWAFGKWE